MNHPKPTALKLLQGNPGKRPLNEKEPQPAKVLPPCPSHLDRIGKKRYIELGNYLLDLGLFTVIDADAFAAYCQLYSDWVKLSKEIKKDGSDVQLKHTIDAGGNEFLEMKPNPRIIMKRETLKLMKSFLSEFGMTPSSRTRLGVEPKGEKNEMEGMID
jgi:P27 family predicted phage terminase small subunit